MFRKIAAASMFAVVTAGLTGCGNNTYNPNASDTVLSSYAGKVGFPSPSDAMPEEARHIFAGLSSDNTITIHNLGDTLVSFDLWVNQTYVLHIDKLEHNTKGVYSPNTLYNHVGTNLAAASGMPISAIQIYYVAGDKKTLLTVQGPEHE